MYTNPSNIVKTLIQLLELNAPVVNKTIRYYEPDAALTVWEGMRQTIPNHLFPSLELDPQSGSNSWATTRAQRPRFSVQGTLTVTNANDNVGVEYISTLVTALVSILTSPENLQLRVVGETRWDPWGGLQDTYILDSLVEDVTYNSNKTGTIRVAEFSWFALIHEPYPQSRWHIGDPSMPTVIRPQLLKLA